MSESSTLEIQVQRVMSERGTWKGSRGIHVQCCVQGCSKRVRKLRLHIRKFHKERCPYSCSACPAKFVGRNDLNNHQRNGCPHRKLACVTNVSVGLKKGKHKAMWQEDLLDLITALLNFNCFLSTTVATRQVFSMGGGWRVAGGGWHNTTIFNFNDSL